MRRIDYIIDEEHSGKRLSELLKAYGFSHGTVSGLKRTGGIILNGRVVTVSETVHTGDILSVCMNDVSSIPPNASLNVRIVYDDDDVTVFDKPAGMPVHQSKGHIRDTLANYFASIYPDITFRAVSRLDKNTSGLVAIAKNRFASSRLTTEEKYRPEKLYYAAVGKGFTKKYGESGRIIAPIAREKEGLPRRIVDEHGSYAETEYRTVMSANDLTLLEIKLHTGRTHQIRVHFSYLGFPLPGDELYGGDMTLISRQALHCGKMMFIHPFTQERIDLSSELPEDISALFR